jgi:hypothetical protein
MIDIDLKHLKKIKTGWFKHFAYATYYNWLALLVFITGTIHSIFPFVFAFTPYKLAKKIVDGTEKNLIKHSEERDDS